MRKRIYIIRTKNTHFYKIGVAVNPFARIETLQIGCPEELEYVVDYAECPKDRVKAVEESCSKRLLDTHREKRLHKLLEKYRIRGEWFQDSPELQKIIKERLEAKIARVKSQFISDYDQFVREKNWEARQMIADWRKSYYCA
jgi:hypothetical protein